MPEIKQGDPKSRRLYYLSHDEKMFFNTIGNSLRNQYEHMMRLVERLAYQNERMEELERELHELRSDLGEIRKTHQIVGLLLVVGVILMVLLAAVLWSLAT